MIGQMRDRILIKGPVDTAVPGAGAETVYVSVLNDWTKVQTVRNSRVLEDNQINIDDALQFSIRWRESININKTMLIEFEGKDYTINSIKQYNNDKRKRFWLITAISSEQPVQIIVS